MTTTREPVAVFGLDADIDLAISDQDEDERCAVELADWLRSVASTDPVLARGLVDQLIVGLDRALDGTFREHLDGVTRRVAERALVNGANGTRAGVSPPRNT